MYIYTRLALLARAAVDARSDGGAEAARPTGFAHRKDAISCKNVRRENGPAELAASVAAVDGDSDGGAEEARPTGFAHRKDAISCAKGRDFMSDSIAEEARPTARPIRFAHTQSVACWRCGTREAVEMCICKILCCELAAPDSLRAYTK